MDKHQTENPAGKAIHHFKVVALLGLKLLQARWQKFIYPSGRKRTLAPWKWEWRDRILVGGEFLAFGAAIAAVPVEISRWSYAPWLIISATIIGTSALLWYAFDLISAGESPLTNRSAHKIRQVVQAMEMEKEGAKFEWENINERGGIPSDLSNWSGLRTDMKAIMDQYNVPLSAAAHILHTLEASRSTAEARPESSNPDGRVQG